METHFHLADTLHGNPSPKELTIKPGVVSEFRRMQAYYLGIRQDNLQNMDQGLFNPFLGPLIGRGLCLSR